MPGRATRKTASSKAGSRCRVDVLDDLDHRRRVEAGEAVIAVGQRALQELHPGPGPGCRQAEPAAGALEGGRRGVDADDRGEPVLLREPPEQPSLAAAEVEHAAGTAGLQFRGDGVEAQVVQADQFLQRPRRPRRRWALALPRRAAGCGRGETVLVPQVAPMRSGPAPGGRPASLAPAQQFLDLVVGDIVVLAVVEHRDEDGQVGEQVRQPAIRFEGHGVEGAWTPLGVGRVQGQRLGPDFVAERLEQPADDTAAAAAG